MNEASGKKDELLRELASLRQRAVELEESERRMAQAEERMRFIVEGVASSVSADFLNQLTRGLAESLKVRYAFISEAVDASYERVRLVSFWTGDGHGDSFTYAIKDTPCEHVVAKNLSCFSSGVQALFPKDKWLKEEGIDSYLAIPLFDSSGRPLGHMGVMDTKPMEEAEMNEATLRIFAARAASEIERKRAEEELKEERRRLAILLSNLPGMAYRFMTDAERTVDFVSEGSRALTGYSTSDLIEKRVSYFNDIVHPADRAALSDTVGTALKNNKPFNHIYRIITAGKTEKWVWEQGIGVYSPEGGLTAVEGFITDITDRIKAEEKIEMLAHFDMLTELPNRSLFYDRLDTSMAYARRNRQSLAILYLDLDGFKPVNDAFGHEIGDKLLKETAKRLKKCVRESDTVARMGGDEFIFIIMDVGSRTDAAVVAEKVGAVFSSPFQLDGHELNIGGSIGISLFPNDASEKEDLIRCADRAMYKAKKDGGNRYGFCSSS